MFFEVYIRTACLGGRPYSSKAGKVVGGIRAPTPLARWVIDTHLRGFFFVIYHSGVFTVREEGLVKKVKHSCHIHVALPVSVAVIASSAPVVIQWSACSSTATSKSQLYIILPIALDSSLWSMS